MHVNSSYIQKEIGTSNMTILYAKKLLQRASILIDKKNDTETDIDKFILLKTLSTDICFACELLLKAIINDYNDEHDFHSWKTHNLYQIYNYLSDEDKNFICNELQLKQSELELILQEDNTSDAFIKRYLYENNTGIPDYGFLCDFSNALLKLKNDNSFFDLKRINILPKDFDYSSFTFDEILKNQTKMIEDKVEIFNITETTDETEEYIIKNMKSCDYAFFSELRFKYFDKAQNPKKEHDFDKLYKRLNDACMFLISKSRYMDRYMNRNSIIDFNWTLRSLMYRENFNAGDTVRELFDDINETFEKSRFCTIDYYDNYYDVKYFYGRIKDITDLLMESGEKVHRILDNKEKLLATFGNDFLIIMSFTVEEMANIDINYLTQISSLTDIKSCPKSILLETDETVRNKVFYFLKKMPNKSIPININQVIDENNNSYHINMEKYEICEKLSSKDIKVTEKEIEKYLELSYYINNEEILLYIIASSLDIDTSIKRYKELNDLCLTKLSHDTDINVFIENVGYTFLKDGNLNEIIKKMNYYEYFIQELVENWQINDEVLNYLINYPMDKIKSLLKIYKDYDYQRYFIYHIPYILEKNEDEIRKQLSVIKENSDILEKYIGETSILKCDLNRLVHYIKQFPEHEYDYINLDNFITGNVEKAYEFMKKKGLEILCDESGFFNKIKDLNIFYELLNNEFFEKIESSNYDEDDLSGIKVYIQKIFENTRIKDVLIDLLDLRIIKDNPKILNVFHRQISTLESVYQLNIYNTWYERIKNNNINCNGSKIKIDDSKKEKILEDMVNVITYSYEEDYTNRFNTIFSNAQLVSSLNKKILKEYDIELMNKITSISKFKEKDFPNYDFFANVFELIDYYNLNEDKVIELFNCLYSMKKDPTVIDFIIKICDTCNVEKKNIHLSSFDQIDGVLVKHVDIIEKKHKYIFNYSIQEKEINNDLIEYILSKINNCDEEEVKKYISEIKIEKQEEINSDYNEEGLRNEYPSLYEIIYPGYDENISIGRKTFETLRDNLKSSFLDLKNNIETIISTKYFIRKIKQNAEKLKNNFKKKVDEKYERKK